MLILALSLALAQDPADEAPGEDVPADDVVELLAPSDVGATAALLGAVYSEVERLRNVAVREASGVVHLTGTVPSVGARDEAEAIAAGRPGVLFVDNQLQVVGDGNEHSAASRDATIQSTLAGIFEQVDGLDTVQVGVTSGVVRLTGTVVDSGTRDKAVALAEALDGVVFVDDGLVESTDVRERLAPAWQRSFDRLEGILSMLPLFAIAGVVLGIAWMVGGWLARWNRPFRRVAHRPLLRNMLARAVRSVVLLIGIVVALEILGATALVGAVAGAAGVVGVAFGFAFQDIVENYLAGVLLSVQQPFSQDDLIEVEGITGVVVRLSMRNTLLLTMDGNHTYLPNATVFKGIVTNYTRNAKRRFAFPIGMGSNEDLTAVVRVGEQTLRATPGVLAEPPPRVRVEVLGDSSVTVTAYGWVAQDSHDYLAVYSEAIRRVKEAYDDAGFDMPEPIYRLRVFPEEKPEAKPRPHVASDEPAVSVAPHSDLLDQVDATRQSEGEDLLG